MIVTCPQCQTRFRIPDEKVTAKGVKVRCTRCRHTFRVSRPAEPAEVTVDPFAQFAPPDALSEQDKTPPRGTPVAALGVEVEPASAPPADDFDVDVEAPDSKRAVRSAGVAGWSFPPVPPRPPDVSAPELPTPDVSDAADVGAPEERTPRVALARIAMVRQLTVVPPPEVSLPEPPAPEARPDERLELDTGSPHSAWQGSIEGGLELPPAPESAEFDFGDLNTLEGPSYPVAAAVAAPPPTVAAPAPPAPTAPSATASLDFDALLSAPEAATAQSVASGVFSTDSFGDLDTPLPPEPRAPTPSHPALDLSALNLDSAPSAAGPSPDGRTPTGELFGRSATRLDEDSFPVGTDPTADRAALFDMPEPLPAQIGAGRTSLLADVPDAAPEAPVHPAEGLPPVPATPIGRVSRPPTGTSVLGLDERREFGAARRVSGAVINIGVAAVLVVVLAAVGNVYVNEGRLDWGALSPSRWAALFVPPTGIVTLDVTNGLYETRGGRPLAYVRGRVENRGQRPGQVKVRAEIWSGSQLLGTSEGLAGVLPTPEEMVEASTRRDVEALRARLQEGAPAVPPGTGADFVLLFDEPPTEVAGLRLKVTAAAAEGK
ncbi:MAG: zinc-ribbon domain-containing protein [Myxococcaceae bacterium]